MKIRDIVSAGHRQFCLYDDVIKMASWYNSQEVILQPRPQGLLLDDFQNGGSSVEDPGTQQKSRDQFVHGGWKFI